MTSRAVVVPLNLLVQTALRCLNLTLDTPVSPFTTEMLYSEFGDRDAEVLQLGGGAHLASKSCAFFGLLAETLDLGAVDPWQYFDSVS